MVVGPDEGGYRSKMEREVQASGLAGDVIFNGPVSDKEKWAVYRQADLFVLPTFTENFGVIIAEALASRLPVITKKAAPWKQIESCKCGWWIDVGVEPLVEALKKATNLRENARSSMGLKGRALIEQEYSWPSMDERMRVVYE
jgi:glycosyltransferase involved in cell wall biosynthesis